MTRSVTAALAVAAALALAAPAHAASPSATVKPPTAGDLTLAHLVFTTKGGKGTPKLVLANKAKLSKQLTIAGGVKKLKKNTFFADIALIQRTGGSSGATPSFKLSLPKGMSFVKFSSKQVGKNLLAKSGAAKWCAAIPKSYAYVAKKLLAGTFLPRFPTAYEYVTAGYQLGCPGGYEDRANLAAAIRGEPDPGAGAGPGSEPGEEEAEGGGTGYSPTLQGTGTVFAEGNGVYRYEISFNEPVFGFLIQNAGQVRCPTEYGEWKAAECDTLEGAQAATGGGQSLPCQTGELTVEFNCYTPASGAGGRAGPPTRPTVPANTLIVGRFKLHPGSTAPSGRVQLTGVGPGGQSQPAALSGP